MLCFEIGQEVVCIDASPVALHMLDIVPVCPLIEGATYKIRGFQYNPASGLCGVYLEEVILPVLDIWKDTGPAEPPWNANRFRPKRGPSEQFDNRQKQIAADQETVL